MVEYEYKPELEVFRRVDNRGPSLKINIVEARRIESMMNLGIKAPTIMKKINFTHNISMTTLRTIMNNIEKGNIRLDGDYPAPTNLIKDMDMEVRIAQLEKDFKEFKKLYYDDKPKAEQKKSKWDKVKSWIVWK